MSLLVPSRLGRRRSGCVGGHLRDLGVPSWMTTPECAKPWRDMRRGVLVLGVALGWAVAAWPADTLAKGEDCTHTVASGQTLGHIANRHGVSQRDLIESNPALKKNPDLLRVGQELDVCVV